MRFPLQRRLLLVRHGESAGNIGARFYGRRDLPLTPKGEAQAQSLRRLLVKETIAAIYTSPLARARQTARILAEPHPCALQTDERLAEQDYGRWDGLAMKQIWNEFGDDFDRWSQGDPEFPPTGGEPLNQVAARIGNFYRELDRFQQRETVVLVGHASTFQALLCQLLNTPLNNRWTFRLALGSVSELWVLETRVMLARLSFTETFALTDPP